MNAIKQTADKKALKKNQRLHEAERRKMQDEFILGKRCNLSDFDGVEGSGREKNKLLLF